MILKLLDNAKTLTQLALDTSEGLGRLSEVTYAKVTEERNGPFTLEFRIPITAKHYGELVRGSIVLAKPNTYDDPQMFRVSRVTKPMNGLVTCYANHITYDLNKTSVSPFQATGATLACTMLKSYMTGGADFDISTDIVNATSVFTNKIPQSFRALLGGQAGSMLDVFGGEYYWDGLTVRLLASRGADRGVELRYGKNLIDLKQEENIDTMYTAVVPFVKMSEEEQAVIGDMQTMVVSSNPRILNLDLTSYFSSDQTVTKEMVEARAQAYIEANDLTSPRINLTVSFVNLADTEEYKDVQMLEQVRLCDEVTVIFERLGVNAKAKVIKTVYDVLAEKYDTIELGNARTNLAQTIVSIEQGADGILEEAEGFTDRAVRHATQVITGGLGGYVVIAQNTDGQPEEILFMDNLDKTQAVKVLRINKNGIGFSSTGYNGPYTNAWTIDGQLVADFITTGNLNANLIKVGTISDAQAKNFWNMVTGDFRLAGSTEVGTGGDTLSSIDSTAKAKKRNFTAQPVPPYDVGDLWCEGVNGDILTCVTARTSSESFNAADWEKKNKYTDDSALTTFLQGTYASDKTAMEGLIDGKAETWYGSTDPAANWSATEKPKHAGDLWYKTTDQTTWRYTGSAWEEQEAPKEVFDAIDGKAQVFTSQPAPPYAVGDLWFNSTTSDIMTCITARASGSYTASDWQKRNKYTDDTAVSNLDNSLDQSGVFNRLTSNGTIQGIYMENGQLYINANYIKSGTLVLGGSNNQNGVLRINNASGTQIGKWDKDGIDINGGKIRTYNGNAWLEISSAEMKGGYTGYSGQAECDLALTLNYSGSRKGAGCLYHSSGYVWMEGSRCFIIGSLHIGDSWGGGTWTGYTGTISGVGYFKNGILTT